MFDCPFYQTYYLAYKIQAAVATQSNADRRKELGQAYKASRRLKGELRKPGAEMRTAAMM